jgi:hypothetical protein
MACGSIIILKAQTLTPYIEMSDAPFDFFESGDIVIIN